MPCLREILIFWVTGKRIDAIMDVITPRQVAAIMEEKFNIPISFGPTGGLNYATFADMKTEGTQLEEMWRNMKYFYDYSNCRGDPRDARKLVASAEMTLTSLEDGLKELHAAGAFNL
jgi:hypothetical protein